MNTILWLASGYLTVGWGLMLFGVDAIRPKHEDLAKTAPVAAYLALVAVSVLWPVVVYRAVRLALREKP